MKIRTLVSAVAAGSLLLGNVAAFAQAEEAQRRQQEQQAARERGTYLPTDPSSPIYGNPARMQREVDRLHREEQRTYHRDPRHDNRYDPRRDDRYDPRHDNRYDPRYYEHRYDPRHYQRWDPRERRYVPADRWGGDWRGRGAGPRHDWYRGSYLPREYHTRHYVVDDWRGHRLYAPPSGYHWVQAPGGDYLLVAVATGLIASILLSQ